MAKHTHKEIEDLKLLAELYDTPNFNGSKNMASYASAFEQYVTIFANRDNDKKVRYEALGNIGQLMKEKKLDGQCINRLKQLACSYEKMGDQLQDNSRHLEKNERINYYEDVYEIYALIANNYYDQNEVGESFFEVWRLIKDGKKQALPVIATETGEVKKTGQQLASSMLDKARLFGSARADHESKRQRVDASSSAQGVNAIRDGVRGR